MPVDKKVSEKSTKQELWQAYNEALIKIEGEPVESGLDKTREETNEALRGLAESKFKIGEQLEKVSQEIITELNDLTSLRSQIIKEKKLILDQLEDQKKALTSEIEMVKMQWSQDEKDHAAQVEEEKRVRAVQRHREEEEYEYELTLTRRADENTFNEKKEQKEKELAEREIKLKDREAEILTMKNELTDMPKKIEEEVKKAEGLLAKELIQKHEIEKREFNLKSESEKKLFELKIANLESSMQNQMKENESLKKQLSEATAQLKQMAVSALENRSVSSRNVPSDLPEVTK